MPACGLATVRKSRGSCIRRFFIYFIHHIMSSTSTVREFLHRPYRNFFLLWIPVLFSILAEPLTGLVDTAFVAKLGAESLAALGVGTVVLTSGMWLFNFLSVGSQTEVSQAFGSQDIDRGRRFGSLALIFAVTVGLLMAVLLVLLAPVLTIAMGATDLLSEHAVIYIRFRALGSPAILVTMTSFGILYGLTDMRLPLVIAVAVNVLNILLDALLIFGFGPIPALGIAGAAIASAISQWIGALWCGYIIHKRIGFTKNIDLADVKKLLAIGRDMFVRTGSLILFMLLATRSATMLGAESGAAHQAIRQVWVFTSLFLDASAITAQSIIGYFFGSGHIDNARKVARLVCYISIWVGLFLMAVMLAGASTVAAILVPASGVVLFYPAWTISAIIQPVAAIAFVTDGIHWGTGDFTYLRNVVISATLCGVLAIILMEATSTVSLSLIWWITGGWVLIRAILGVFRIWPGMSTSRLNSPVIDKSEC